MSTFKFQLIFSIIFPLGLLLPGVDLTKSYSGFVTKTVENASKFRASEPKIR